MDTRAGLGMDAANQTQNKMDLYIPSQQVADMGRSEDTEFKMGNREIKKDDLSKLGRAVKDGYNADLESLDDLHSVWDESLKLATQVLEKKTFPFEKASNIIYPIITEAAINFNAIMYPNVMADGNICKAKVIGDDEGQPVIQMVQTPQGMIPQPVIDPQTGQVAMQGVGMKAKLASTVSAAINYQINEDMIGWEEELDKMLIMLPIIGCMFKKVYFDELEGKVCSDLLLPHYFVVNFGAKNLESAPRMTQVLKMYEYEIQDKINSGLFYDLDYRVGESEFPDNKTQKTTSLPTDDIMKPHMVLEQHIRYDLDGDGYAEPLIVFYHYDSGKVMRVEENYDIKAALMNPEGKIIYAKPKTYFVKFGFIPNPRGGFYDIGFGQLLLGLNTGINTIINQCIDAGTLSVAGGGFIGRGVRMKAGTLRFKPAEWKIIETTGASLKENIFPMPYNEPSPVLFQLLGLLIESAEKIGSMRDILGREAASNQTATTTLSLIEQGVKSLKAISKRIFRGVKNELKLIFELNQKYYPQINPFGLTKEMFDYKLMNISPNMDVENLTNSLKLARAQLFVDLKNSGYQCIDEYETAKEMANSIQVENVDKIVKPVEPTSQEIELQQMLAKNEQEKIQSSLLRENNRSKELEIKAAKVSAEIPKIEAETLAEYASAAKDYRDAGEPYKAKEIAKIK